jgi:ATP-binding cassette subfamily B protein
VTTLSVIAGDLTVGQLVLTNAYILQLFRPIENFGFSYRDVRQQFTAVLRFIDLFVAEQEIDTGTETMPATLQRIVVENVSFSYGNGRKALDTTSLP